MAHAVPITAETLNALSDGLLGRMVNSEIDRINRDLIDRGHDAQPRKLKIEIVFKIKNDRLTATPKVKAELPALEATPTIARYDQRAGGFMFSPDAADNPDQPALPKSGRDD